MTKRFAKNVVRFLENIRVQNVNRWMFPEEPEDAAG